MKKLWFLGLICMLFWSSGLMAQEIDPTAQDSLKTPIPLDSLATDSIRIKKMLSDSLGISIDSLASDSTSLDSVAVIDPKQVIVDSLKAISDLKEKVTYHADDSIIFDMKEDMLYLYGNAWLEYETTRLDAAKIRINWANQTMYAQGTEGPNGEEMGLPKFKEGSEEYEARQMSYNFKTKKARIVLVTTRQEPDLTIISDTTKRLQDGTMFAKGVIFTPCECEDDEEPTIYFRSKKVKVLPNNSIISGPLNLVVAGFPLPVVVPFAFIPEMKQEKQRSGIIMPQYGDAQERGFFLRNLGYYFGGGERFDLLLEGDIYTRGGWRLAAKTNYNVRYKFDGNLELSYGVVRFGEKNAEFTDPDFSETSEWAIRWSHNQPINPTTRISARVNMSSQEYNRTLSNNLNDAFQNNLNSSVSFQKGFNSLPINLSATANVRQDLTRNTISMDLPTVNLSVNRFAPFKNVSSKKGMQWLTKLGINYSAQASNRLTTAPFDIFPGVILSPRDSFAIETTSGDSTNVLGSSFLKSGINHRASTSTNIKVLKHINMSMSARYNEYWYFEETRRFWDGEAQRVQETIVPGFTPARDFSTSVSASTNFYGIYSFVGKKQFAIRQRFSPTISYNLRPDFSAPRYGYYEEVQSNADGRTTLFNRLSSGIYGSPSAGESQSIGFGLSSVMEMKYRSKESFEEDFDEKQDKFVRTNLIDNLSISGSYNYVADSLNLTPISLNARTRLFETFNLNTSASLDPYVYQVNAEGTSGTRINKFTLSETGSIGRITRAQVSLSANFRPKKKPTKQKNDDFDETEFEQIRNNLDDYVDFDIPWSLNFSYNLSYNNNRPGVADPTVTQTMRFSGDLAFSPKWKIQYSSGYDLEKLKLSTTSLTIYRDLNCWNMSFTWNPFGTYKSYFLTLTAKSPTLSALRLTKRSQYQDRRFLRR